MDRQAEELGHGALDCLGAGIGHVGKQGGTAQAELVDRVGQITRPVGIRLGCGAAGEAHALEVAGNREHGDVTRLRVDAHEDDGVGADSLSQIAGVAAQKEDVQALQAVPESRSRGWAWRRGRVRSWRGGGGQVAGIGFVFGGVGCARGFVVAVTGLGRDCGHGDRFFSGEHGVKQVELKHGVANAPGRGATPRRPGRRRPPART